MVAAAAVVTALHNVTRRQIDPLDAAVISVTQICAGDTWNVIPERAILRGTTRALRPETQDILESSIRRIAENVAIAHECSADVRYQRRYPPTINDATETERAVAAAHLVVGEGNVLRDLPPTMGAEDFAFMLKEKPGCYMSIGNGPADGGCTLHSPKYDFNDAILPIGASYWAKLAESVLA